MEGASSPRVAAAGGDGLRPHRILDNVDAAIMMDDLDDPTEYSSSVGFGEDDDGVVVAVGLAMAVQRAEAASGGGAVDGSVILRGSDPPIRPHRGGHRRQPWLPPSMLMVEHHTGAPRVYRIRVWKALSLLLSMILRAIVTTKRLNCDSDDEYGVVSDGNRQPLLNSQGSQNPSLISMENNGSNNNRWSTRMREKSFVLRMTLMWSRIQITRVHQRSIWLAFINDTLRNLSE
ncbi:hypothetical protein ACLOJK_007529 [Asimina triloba]